MTNQALTLQFGKHGQRFLDGFLAGFHDSSNPKIDDIQRIETKVSQVVMEAVDELLAGESMNPRLVGTAPSAQFGDDHETIAVRMEGLLDDLIGHMRSVVVAGVNMA